jgi:membrane protein YdbS with pleckstrin-like domain
MGRYRVVMSGLPEHGAMSPSPRLWRMRCTEVIAGGGVIAVAAGTIAGLAAGPVAAVVAVAIVLLGSLAALSFARNRFRSWTYTERDEDLIVQRGVMIRRLSVVPYGRMQFVDVTAGPIDRLFRLATVKLHTAAAASDARIPGLERDEAARLRDRLAVLGEAKAAGL